MSLLAKRRYPLQQDQRIQATQNLNQTEDTERCEGKQKNEKYFFFLNSIILSINLALLICPLILLMETIFSSHSLSPLFNVKASSTKALLSPSVHPRSNSLICTKSITCNLRKHQPLSLKPSLSTCTNWLSHAQQGLAALAISLALNFSPLLHSGNALASEFDVLNEGPPQESFVVDDAGVLSRVTRSDLKQLLSDLESRKKFHINFITVRKLTVSNIAPPN